MNTFLVVLILVAVAVVAFLKPWQKKDSGAPASTAKPSGPSNSPPQRTPPPPTTKPSPPAGFVFVGDGPEVRLDGFSPAASVPPPGYIEDAQNPGTYMPKP